MCGLSYDIKADLFSVKILIFFFKIALKSFCFFVFIFFAR